MESAAANLVEPGEPALVASCGKFGERWVELCEAFGAEVVHYDAGWGNRVEPEELERRLAGNPGVEVVFTTLSETSTGVVNDIRALTEVAHAAGALIAVDAVSGLGAVPVPQDEWGVDLAVTGSLSALIWFRAARTVGAEPSIRRVSRLGVVLVPVSMVAAALALHLFSSASL